MRKYYTLVELINGRWAPQFGDYTRFTVEQERKDQHIPRARSKIICTSDQQAFISAHIEEMNKGIGA